MPDFPYLGTVFQGATFVTLLLAIVGGAFTVFRYWIQGTPERNRVLNEGRALQAKIETDAKALQLKIAEDLQKDTAEWLQKFRDEIHLLRNELGVARAELHRTAAVSLRRGDKLNMMLFILRLVMDELASKDPDNKVLKQANQLLTRIEDEPHVEGNSTALNQAEDTVEAAQATVREVKADEAKGPRE